ncbi:MAG: molecular chaperone HtpG [Oscillospiraceae bacterium]|nr:molecular chaperone HtpG [Oscillospiraceae bacterium]
MAKKQFKAESKRLLDMMIHSIYTHREIFLRELISNASDAIDKLYYQTLQDGNTGLSREDFSIEIIPDKEKRTLTVRDNGCGMTREELENNLGTIAKSGSLAFKKENDAKEDIDIIGQFGVGFYSAFMVSDDVTVVSRPFGASEAWKWYSTGSEGYTVEPAGKDSHGTEIIMKIKDNTEEDNYDEFLDPWRLRGIVKKYSDYIRYPIRMDVEKSRPKAQPEGEEAKDKEPEYETYTEKETLNSMVPIWRKNKSELTHEDYCNFYRDKFFDYNEPLRVIHSSTEGASTYNALLFIPGKAPFDYYSREYEKGLQLYSNGVLIMDKCPDLLPDCFSFVRGLVDSQDLSLNISREMLQHDRQLKIIAGRLEKKIKSELEAMLRDEREKYVSFFQAFGRQLKFGVYGDYGAHADLLKDLLLFHSSAGKELTTLAEYAGRMPEGQKAIYYACGDTVEHIEQLPQTELVRDKGYEILYLTEDVDEFAFQAMRQYQEKPFQSVSAGDLDLESEEEKKQAEEQAAEHKDLFAFMAEALGGKVKEVRLSRRLKSHPVCLTADGAISLEMEKVFASMPAENKPKAERVLELNPGHPVFQTLTELYQNDREKLKTYADILYGEALLIEGMPVEDPTAFANAVCALMTK